MTAARIVMFVLNPVRFDRRVLREAASLASAGCIVTVYGTADEGVATASTERHPDGFDIVRVPLPGRSGLWSSRRADYADAWRDARTGHWTADRILRAAGRPPWWALKTAVAAGSYGVHFVTGGHTAWVVNARRRWWAWGREVMKLVGPADVYHGHDLPGLGVAIHARAKYGGQLVYDSHDLFLE